MRNYKRRLELVHSALAVQTIPHMTDTTLEEVQTIFNKYEPHEPMTPQDTRRWFCALSEGYELKKEQT